MKKFIAVLTILILSANIVNAKEYDQDEINMNLEQTEKAAKIEDTLRENGYPDYYGGVYISDDSTHVVMLIVEDELPTDKDSKEYMMLEDIINENQNLEIKYVENSYKKLQEIDNSLNEYIEENKITGHYVDVINNKVGVSVKDLEKRNIYNVKNEMPQALSNVLTFEKTKRIEMNSIDAGQGIIAGGKDNCSMGYRVKINNKEGYITAAHCFSGLNDASTGGTVKKWRKGGTIDAAFVEIISNYLLIQNPTNNLKYTKGVITKLNTNAAPTLIVNQVIAKAGVTTGYTTGKILKVSETIAFDGYTINNMISADYYGTFGDSGGVVFIPKNVNGGATVIGIHIAARDNDDGHDRLAVKSSEIEKAFKYTRY